MLSSATFVVAGKELVDHWRDRRSVALSVLYALMGPVVMALAFMRSSVDAPSSDAALGPIMAAVFALMAVFTGSMAAAMDTVAGERDRRSLVPLVLSVPSRWQVVVGKWVALTVLSAVSLLMTLTAYRFVLGGSSPTIQLLSWGLTAPALLTLIMLAASSQLFVSTLCHSTREAHTYVSILVFTVMGVAMWIAFAPAAPAWSSGLPLVGQQRLLTLALSGTGVSIRTLGGMALDSAMVGVSTGAVSLLTLYAAVRLFERDVTGYGG